MCDFEIDLTTKTGGAGWSCAKNWLEPCAKNRSRGESWGFLFVRHGTSAWSRTKKIKVMCKISLNMMIAQVCCRSFPTCLHLNHLITLVSPFDTANARWQLFFQRHKPGSTRSFFFRAFSSLVSPQNRSPCGVPVAMWPVISRNNYTWCRRWLKLRAKNQMRTGWWSPCDWEMTPLWEIHFGEMLLYTNWCFFGMNTVNLLFTSIFSHIHIAFIIILSMVLRYLAVLFWSFGWFWGGCPKIC